MEHKIVITRHRPWFRTGLTVAIVGVIALGAWLLYAYTRATTVSDFQRAKLDVEQLREERRQLTRDLRTARAEIGKLRDQVTYVQRSQEIDTEACSTVRESLQGLQTEVSDLREQLAFYRGIVSPDLSRAGVRVYDFKLRPLAVPNSYRFELVLIQSVRHDRRIGGRIELTVEGLRDGLMETLTLEQIGTGEGRNLVFSFKYFEEFSGELTLPERFSPTRVRVRLAPETDGAPLVEDQFDWQKSLSS